MGVLIDGGASHNFIDAAWVKRRDIQTESFDGFSVAAASHTMEFSQRDSSINSNNWELYSEGDILCGGGT